MLYKFQCFCVNNNKSFLVCDTSTIVDFLCALDDGSSRPQSQIKVAFSALGHLFNCVGIPYDVNSPLVSNLYFGTEILFKCYANMAIYSLTSISYLG